jgi:Ni/Co efflux regulator RcnB
MALSLAHAGDQGRGQRSFERPQGGGGERQGRGGGDRSWSPREMRGPERGYERGGPDRGSYERGGYERGGSERRVYERRAYERGAPERRAPERGGRYVDERRAPSRERDPRYRDDPRGRSRWEDPGPYGRGSPGYPAPYPRAPGVRPGGYLPPTYRGAPVDDYRRYRLRPPPRGYNWVRVGDGFALVSPDGQIFDMVR